MNIKLLLYGLALSCTYLLPALPAQAQELQVQVQKIAPQVYMHTSYGLYKGSKVPANGLLLNTADGVVIIDTAWDDEQTEQLLTWIKKNLKKPVKMCIVTHSHEDRIGGAKTLQQKAIPMFSTKQTAQLALEQHGIKTDPTLPLVPMRVGRLQLEAYYPGPGHAPDNIVVYLPKQKILFGGCFVKDAAATNLGNLADANVATWAGAIEKLQEKFPEVKTVVPGHGATGNAQLLEHTKTLVLEHQQKK